MRPWVHTVNLSCAAALWVAACGAAPVSRLNLNLDAPIRTWDEAIPLGNGSMGVLLWGETNLLRLSLDRGDLWDERPSAQHVQVRDRFNYATMQRLVAQNKMSEFNQVFDSNYDYHGPPSKLPAGRLEILVNPCHVAQRFELDLANAEGIVHFRSGGEARAFVDAAHVDEPVALLRIPGSGLQTLRLMPPASVAKLGYPPAQTGQAANLHWFVQPGTDGFEYAVVAGWKSEGDSTLVAFTVTKPSNRVKALAIGQSRVRRALAGSFEKRLRSHTAWWRGFWSQSSVSLPEDHILRHYYLVRYFYGAASRKGAPPMPLQGVWTADTGELPPWKGDYHNDLNTQMTYLAYLAAGHFQEGSAFLDLLWDLLPRFRQFAREFYETPGAAVPGVMSLAGQPLGGWGQYSLSPTMGAWNAHLFYLHWRYTSDDRFLRTRAYPWCREIGECLVHLLKPDASGILKLPLSSSPEIFDNTRRAFLLPNSNYDLMSLKMLFLSLAEMATACAEPDAAEKYRATAVALGKYHVGADGTLLLDEQTALPGSHRHLSNLMALHPFNLLTVEGTEYDRQTIEASLQQWDRFGTKAWCGYSFSWMSALRARVGEPEAAARYLDTFVKAFILRNGFHANGDQTRSGLSDFTYRPFTLEGNFLAMQAVHEMLLQSWNAHPGTNKPAVIRIFPAMPERWSEAEFNDLRAEGGLKVSARREKSATTWFRIVAGSRGIVRVRDNFGGRTPQWSVQPIQKAGDDFVFELKRGQAVEARLSKPTAREPGAHPGSEPVNQN